MITFLRPLSEQPPDQDEDDCECHTSTDADGKVSHIFFVRRVPKRPTAQPATTP